MKNSLMKLGVKPHQVRGFTLIEVLIVVAIIGAVAAVAVPSYVQYIVRTNQADAKDKLTEVMFQMERHITRNRSYVTDLTALGYATEDVDSDDGLYTISAAACGADVGLNRCVQLTATPIEGTRQDGTGAFTLNSRGERTFDGTVGGWKK